MAPHVGRGGWTWYPGSAGWLLRVALESGLGLTVEEGRPCCAAIRPLARDGAEHRVEVELGAR